MLDSLYGWLVGNDQSGGRIFFTHDGWATWMEYQGSPAPKARYYDIAFADRLHGWIVGENGLIMHTKDGGGSWAIQAANLTANHLRKLAVIDSKNAFACGTKGTILYTNDGQNWKQATILSWFPNDLLGIAMFDAQHGIAVGRNGTIFYTKNGSQWLPPFLPPMVAGKDYNAVATVNASQAWLVGSYTIDIGIKWTFAKTEDGGNSWQLKSPSDQCCHALSAITFVNGFTGIVAGAHGSVWMTHDNEHWKLLEKQFGHDGLAIAVVGNKIWIAGRGGSIAYSPDLGLTWSILPSMTSNFLYKIRAINENRIVAIGYASTLEYSDNGGIDWKTTAVIADNESAIQLWGIDFANEQLGWVAGTDGFIARTMDGCKTWQRQGAGLTNRWLRDVWAFDENDAWIVGDMGIILHTTNGGTTWRQNPRNITTKDLFDIEGLNHNQIVAVGDQSTFIYSTDAGQNWRLASHNLDKKVKINSVYLIDETHAWAVGEAGTVMFSSDGGATWTQQPFPVGSRLEGVHFMDATTGYIVGEGGQIFETKDGGQGWHIVAQEFTNRDLKSIEITSDGKILICGYYGVIVRYGPGPILRSSDDENSVPLNYVFHPNYPNPFNDHTILRYQLPMQTHVSLAVYNLMGQLIETLVDEEQMAGSYVIDWLASGQASGIYFFKLSSPAFNAVQKGLLLK